MTTKGFRKGAILLGTTIATATALLTSATVSFAQSKSVPSEGSGYKGGYSTDWNKWNLFQSLLGKSGSEIKNGSTGKIDKAYHNFVSGADSVRLVNTFDNDESYVYAGQYYADNSVKEVLSEGQSYGMMVAVQMNDQSTFDKLWRFAKTRMQHNGQSPRWYYLSWRVGIRSDGSTYKIDSNSAADGEAWFAAALTLAANRWGSSTGMDYRTDAHNILRTVLHTEEWNAGKNNPDNVGNLFNSASDSWPRKNQIRFVPSPGFWTDPSYHLPAFWELFANYGPDADKGRWWDIAWMSRVYLLPRACGSNVFGTRPNSSGLYDNGTTGLAPNYSDYEGKAYANPYNSDNYGLRYDAEAWRVASNVGVDYMWWKKTSGTDFDQLPVVSNRILTYFHGIQGYLDYDKRYAYSDSRYLNGTYFWGTEYSGAGHRAGAAAMHAVAALASNRDFARNFVEEMWYLNSPSEDRYYSGSLYMLGLLEISGNFRVYLPGNK